MWLLPNTLACNKVLSGPDHAGMARLLQTDAAFTPHDQMFKYGFDRQASCAVSIIALEPAVHSFFLSTSVRRTLD